MNVESVYGVGSNFSFTIPIRQSFLEIQNEHVNKLAYSIS